MKIGIYNESTQPDSIIGGSEAMALVLAEALSHTHEVDFVHHKPSLTKEKFVHLFGVNLDKVTLRHVPEEKPATTSRNPWIRLKNAHTQQASLSQPYDLFVTLVHKQPPFCHSPQGISIVLFPFVTLPHLESSSQKSARGRWEARSKARELCYGIYTRWEWKKRMETYQAKTAISEFTRKWTALRWGVDCSVLYPPVNCNYVETTKSNCILSVGRFTSVGVLKRQLEMAKVFCDLQGSHLQNWNYLCAGGLGDRPDDRAYFDSVQAIEPREKISLIPNVERHELKHCYERSKIFWHAAGYGEDESLQPEMTEHFGIVTVEAMAAGCVPIVVNKGAQGEIVEHGVNGFLWNNLEELKEYTSLVASDEKLREKLSQAARVRARYFSNEEFISRFLSLL